MEEMKEISATLQMELPDGFKYEIGKKYAGSAFMGPTGIFTYRPYGKREKVKDENGEEVQQRFVSEDNLCTVFDYKDKYTIKIDIPKAKLTATVLFNEINKQIKFLNNILFKCKTSPRAGRNPK